MAIFSPHISFLFAKERSGLHIKNASLLHSLLLLYGIRKAYKRGAPSVAEASVAAEMMFFAEEASSGALGSSGSGGGETSLGVDTSLPARVDVMFPSMR